MTFRRSVTSVAALLAAAALVLAACGDDSDAGSEAAEPRTVEIEMQDIKYSPNRVEVTAGEEVRFEFHNTGAVAHDAFIGDEDAQDEHEMDMRAADSGDGDGMDHGGEAENAVTVDPDETGELTYTFKKGDEILIGCHQPGHYDAGMTLMIEVS